MPYIFEALEKHFHIQPSMPNSFTIFFWKCNNTWIVTECTSMIFLEQNQVFTRLKCIPSLEQCMRTNTYRYYGFYLANFTTQVRENCSLHIVPSRSLEYFHAYRIYHSMPYKLLFLSSLQQTTPLTLLLPNL